MFCQLFCGLIFIWVVLLEIVIRVLLGHNTGQEFHIYMICISLVVGTCLTSTKHLVLSRPPKLSLNRIHIFCRKRVKSAILVHWVLFFPIIRPPPMGGGGGTEQVMFGILVH